TRSGLTLHRVRDGARDAGDAEEVLLGLLDTLGDGRGHLLGLAVADAHGAVAVAHHDERGEAEAAATLDDLGYTVDRDDALQILVALLVTATATVVTVTVVPAVAAASATVRAVVGAAGGTGPTALVVSHQTVLFSFRLIAVTGTDRPLVRHRRSRRRDRRSGCRHGRRRRRRRRLPSRARRAARRPAWPWPACRRRRRAGRPPWSTRTRACCSCRRRPAGRRRGARSGSRPGADVLRCPRSSCADGCAGGCARHPCPWHA